MAARVGAIVPAAGAGRRMGADKALLDIGGTTAIERVVAACTGASVASIIVVRAAGAAPLPAALLERVTVVEIGAGGEMIDSVRAGLRALPAADVVLLFPVDYAMVGAATVALLLVHLFTDDGDPEVVLPLFRERPGHPIVVSAALTDEILQASTATLRDVIRRPGRRVRTVATADEWVSRDLDTPADLHAARGFAAWRGLSPVSQMIDHRSRRAYHPDPIDDSQLERFVEAARCASTSSMMQAYAVVAVREPARKARVAALCADQRHILEAPLFLAICADLHKLALACERHGKQLDPDSLEIFLEATIDAALLAQNLLLAAESEGLGGCMLGAARNHPVELATELALPPQVYVVFGMVLGRPADDPIRRGRMPIGGVLHLEQYDVAGLDLVLRGADAGMQSWAKLTNAQRGGYQGRPVNENKGWTDRMAALWSTEKAPKARRHLRDALRRLGFGLDDSAG